MVPSFIFKMPGTQCKITRYKELECDQFSKKKQDLEIIRKNFKAIIITILHEVQVNILKINKKSRKIV